MEVVLITVQPKSHVCIFIYDVLRNLFHTAEAMHFNTLEGNCGSIKA